MWSHMSASSLSPSLSPYTARREGRAAAPRGRRSEAATKRPAGGSGATIGGAATERSGAAASGERSDGRRWATGGSGAAVGRNGAAAGGGRSDADDAAPAAPQAELAGSPPLSFSTLGCSSSSSRLSLVLAAERRRRQATGRAERRQTAHGRRRATARAAAREARGVDGDVGPREEAAEQVELLVLTTTTTTRSSGAAMALAELRRGEGVGDMADEGSACAREIWPPPPQAPRAPSLAAGHALSVAAREEASSSGRPAGDEAAHAG
jgi:hypothetical protein|uniref:Uncharacterized protein n=1 Tax=Oryza sativa subsp. japonica TaxID=39947 RepID=Q650S6_ORYSJ|nr:hypothetical protein [Oryza sativa Japonica Group]BAD46691.1 hypothetical protein [Oryza sativa Japonica Group]